MDTRPFLRLTTPGGAVLKCKQPKVLPLSLGVGSSTGGVVTDNPTHTIDVILLGKADTSELTANAVVWVDVEKGKPPLPFLILRNGISRSAAVWKLYVRAEDGRTAPAPAGPDPVSPTPQQAPAPGLTEWIDP